MARCKKQKGEITLMPIKDVIAKCMLDNDYIDSTEQVKAIDEWHYQVEGEMRVWNKKEYLLSEKFNAALVKKQYNVQVKVKLSPKDDSSFIIDLSEHEIMPYFMLMCYDRHYNSYNIDIPVSRDAKGFYHSLIGEILQETADIEERMERIRELLESDMITLGDSEYMITTIKPKQLLSSKMVIVGEPPFNDDTQIINRSEYTDEEWEDKIEEFDMGASVYCINM